jgi:formylglycine-generating enzyme required for sulfatase activity
MEFSIGKYPVTNLEYVRFVESAGSKTLPAGLSEASTGPFLPVVGISQRDALEYCRWLSDSLKRKYRIPTEREWICAATRANADSFGNRRGFANYGYRFGGPTVVGAFRRPDADDGCSDLFGNVWEWCLDRYPEQPWRVLKGGSFRSVAHELTPWFRRGELIAHRSPFVGFRVVREE